LQFSHLLKQAAEFQIEAYPLLDDKDQLSKL